MSVEAAPSVRPELRHATGAWVWDVPADRLYGDARFAGLMGLDPAEAAAGLNGAAFFTGVHPEDRLRVKIAVAGIMRGAEVFNKDFRVVSDTGTRWVSGRGRAESGPEGVVRFRGVLVDITEQKRIEEQLRIAQSAGGVGTFEHVDGFGTASVSAQFCQLLGLYPTDSLPVRTINGVVHPDDPAIIQGLEIGHGNANYSEIRIRRADTGEERWLARRGEHRSDDVGHGARFIGVIYDITTGKRAELQLRDLAHTLEERVAERTRERDRVWTLSRDLLAVISSEGVYRAVNPAWREVLGYADADLVGSSRGELVHPEDLELAGQAYAALLTGKPVENLDLRVIAADGEYRWINWTIVPDQDVLYAMGRDVTERKLLEEQLRQSQKMEAVGQLTGGLAHDFNNMLTGIIGGIDLARRRLQADRASDADRFLDAAVTSAERAAALTHRLLAFSRRQTLDTRSIDIGALIRSMEEMLRRTLGEQVEMLVVAPGDLWPARTDANQLESAILNLAINARDAMPGGGRLVIACENRTLERPQKSEPDEIAAGEYVVMTISDTGSGMPANIRAKVFDPFFTTKPIGQGTGLGLSMVYGFVRQSGGAVGISSEAGQGTTIALYLPRHGRGDSIQDAPASATPAHRGRGETVLVVEDDPQVRMVVETVLGDLGYSPRIAANGASAMALLQSGEDVRLLVTDVGLPGINGRQLADIARQKRPGLPVLFVTGYAASVATQSEFLEPGMRMIAKPFSMDALGRMLAEVLGAAEGDDRGL